MNKQSQFFDQRKRKTRIEWPTSMVATDLKMNHKLFQLKRNPVQMKHYPVQIASIFDDPLLNSGFISTECQYRS